jgi:AcrR family transcriptional regulator
MTEQDARSQILAAAMSLFARQGFANTSMNDIVRESGLSKGGVYWHFKSKDDLIAAIFDSFFGGQERILASVLGSQASAADKLTQLAQLASADLEAVFAAFPASLEFHTLAAHSEPLRTRLRQFYDAYHQQICALLEEGIGEGIWAADTAVSPTAYTLIAAFEGVILLWSLFPDATNLSEQLTTAVNLLLRGLENREIGD